MCARPTPFVRRKDQECLTCVVVTMSQVLEGSTPDSWTLRFSRQTWPVEHVYSFNYMRTQLHIRRMSLTSAQFFAASILLFTIFVLLRRKRNHHSRLVQRTFHRSVPSIVASELSEDSTEETTLKAKGLSRSIYLGT